jgi:Ribbon-helix-helix protein, copG family
VRTAATPGLTQFLGVRLTDEELRQLDEFQRARGIATRSDAVRKLVRDAAEVAPPAPPLPLTVQRELEEMVEDGWARNEEGALTLLATLGLQELSRLHADRMPALRGAARASRERHPARRKADREGRGLLER